MTTDLHALVDGPPDAPVLVLGLAGHHDRTVGARSCRTSPTGTA